MSVSVTRVLTVVLLLAAVACGGSTQPDGNEAGSGLAPDTRNVSTDRNDYPVFPDVDSGADPAVPAEQGGAGFTGAGWETNTDFDLIGDPRAVKGGTYREYMLSFPGTLRVLGGPESNTALNYMIAPMVYETLLTLHPTTLDWIPALATHWQISDDRMTYRFRINPNARWSDGEPVVAGDVVASWEFVMDEGLQDPGSRLVFSKFKKPVAESKYIVRVESTELNWRNFLYFAGSMYVIPAHVLARVDGATYLKEYNFKLIPGTGPYIVNEADIVKGQSVTIRRRPDYWAANHRRNIGVGNFDEVREIVVRDQKLAFEMFKRGDLDSYAVNISREWVEELDFDRVQRGLIQKRKIFNDAPTGTSGLAFNTRREPWNDIRVRQAMAHLLNRELLIERLFYNEYVPLNTYFGGPYANPDNPAMSYDPARALELLAQAGWARDGQNRLLKNGRPLSMELLYSDQGAERWLTVYQEDLRKVGIGLNLRLVTPETFFSLVMQRRFDVASMAWGGLVFPNPETSWHSMLADVPNNNNLTGFKDPRVDALLPQYDREFDQERRIAIIQEIDGILANAHHYALGWDAPFHRIAYWNKFGHPDSYLTRIGDPRDIPTLWWIDAGKEQQLAEAMRSASVDLPVGDTDVRYWEDYDRRNPPPAAGTD